MAAEVRRDWEKQRCLPQILPFAGYIKKGPDQLESSATKENYAYCSGLTIQKSFNITSRPTLDIINQKSVEFADITSKLDEIVDEINVVRRSTGGAIYRQAAHIKKHVL